MLTFYLSLLEEPSDKALFTDVYEQNLEKMMTIAKSILISPESAKDAVHDTFIKLIDNFDKFTALDMDCRKGWIVITTRNTAISILRKEKRSFPAANDSYLFNNVDSSNFNADFYDLMEAIKTLPEKYKNVLEMYYIYGYSYQEISQIYDISDANAMQRVSRAKKMLLEKLKDC